MPTEIRPVPDSPQDHEPAVVATPEGDNEFPFDVPLKPLPEGALEDPRGNEPDSYKEDHA